MPLQKRRVPTIKTRITFRVMNRDVPMRTILVVGGSALLVLLIGAWVRPPLLSWLVILPVAIVFVLVALRVRPRGMLPEEWLRRKALTIWVPRRMVWAPRSVEETPETISGVAVRPLFFEEAVQEETDR